MSDYVPTTEEVRMAYVGAKFSPFRKTDAADRAEFERWLASVKAAAWDEAIGEAAEQGTIQIPTNPYRDKETP